PGAPTSLEFNGFGRSRRAAGLDSKARARARMPAGPTGTARLLPAPPPETQKAPLRVPSSSMETARGPRRNWAPYRKSAGVIQRNLLDAGEQPARVVTLVQVPDFLETDEIGRAHV